MMIICLITMGIFWPRFTIIFLWLLTNWFEQAYNTFIWPFLGFFLMPYTVLIYMVGQLNSDCTSNPFYGIVFILAIILDISRWAHKDIDDKEEANA